jgi:hypothetical protein
MVTVTSATAASVLAVLTKARLVGLARSFDLTIPADAAKATQMAAITAAEARFDAVLPGLARDELRTACRAHGDGHVRGARRRASTRASAGRRRRAPGRRSSRTGASCGRSDAS